MDQSEWGARQQAREDKKHLGCSAVHARAVWINDHAPLDRLGGLVWSYAENEMMELAFAIANAGPTLGTANPNMIHLGNSIAFQALAAVSGGDGGYMLTGQFVRALDGAADYARTMRVEFSPNLLAAMLAFDEALNRGLDDAAKADLGGVQ